MKRMNTLAGAHPLCFQYLVFNAYRDQLEISDAEEQGVSDHPYSVEAQYVEHGKRELQLHLAAINKQPVL